MLIIGNKYGQLGNRLFLFSHFIANAVEYDYFLINPNFSEYCHYFPSTRDNHFGNYKISVRYSYFHYLFSKSTKYILPVLCSLFKTSPFHQVILGDEEVNLNDDSFINKVKSKKMIITRGWLFRDFKNFNKHSKLLKEIFTPLPSHQEKISAVISNCRESGADIIVGVHMRRNDYRQFRGGMYFFDDKIYYDKMKKIEVLFNKRGKNVSFLIASDETIDFNNFKGLNIQSAPGHPLEDLYSLSECDYIIGPPSSYSMWASFYGGTPLLHITNRDEEVNIDNFKVNRG